MKVMVLTRLLAVALAGALVLGGCAPSLSGGAYSRSQTQLAQQVQMGYVESVREVRIEGTKTPIGAGAGAALGGLAASNIGGGRGQAAATIGGVLLGGLIGAAAEEGITRQPGLEITVRLDDGRYLAVAQAADEPFYPGERVRVLTAYDGTARIAH